MKGSKGAELAVPCLMGGGGPFVPHQLFVALSVEPPPTTGISRLLPLGAVLPASRVKCMLRVCGFAPSQMPPPPGAAPAPPGAELPVIATLLMVRLSPIGALNQMPPPLPPTAGP